jgi:hypothetical protein
LFTGSTWSAAPDPAAPEPVEPVTEPSHPKPAATARTVAAGVLFAALATAIAASVVLVVTAFRLLGSGDVRLELGGPPAVLLAVAFASAAAAALLFLTRDWAPPRFGTLALAFVVSIAWPLSGIALPAALIAVLAVGLALGRDRRSGGGRRVTGWPAIAAFASAALVLALAGAAIAKTHPAPPPKAAAPVETGADAAPPTNAQSGESGAAQRADGGSAPTGKVDSTSPAEAETVTTAEQAPLGKAATPPALDAEAPPASDADPVADDARRFVRDYYRALDERRFEDAWTTLSPAVKKRFGGFTGWKAGYAKTLYSKPRTIAVTASGATVTVTHLLVARDEGCSADSRFNVTWALNRSGEQWTVTALSASVAGANTAKCR